MEPTPLAYEIPAPTATQTFCPRTNLLIALIIPVISLAVTFPILGHGRTPAVVVSVVTDPNLGPVYAFIGLAFVIISSICSLILTLQHFSSGPRESRALSTLAVIINLTQLAFIAAVFLVLLFD